MYHLYRTSDGIDALYEAKRRIEEAIVYMELNPKTCRRDPEEAVISIQAASNSLFVATLNIMRDT